MRFHRYVQWPARTRNSRPKVLGGGIPIATTLESFAHAPAEPYGESVRLEFESEPSEVVVERKSNPDAGTTHDLKAHHVDEAQLAQLSAEDPAHRRLVHRPVHEHRRDREDQLIDQRSQRLDPKSALHER